MNNIFIDIGAHIGESLEEVLRPIYELHEVVAIEPSSFGYTKLLRFRDSRLTIHKTAVSNFEGETTLFAAGSVGASLFPDKSRHWSSNESVKVTKFSKFCYENINKYSNIYVKINIEGSEFFLLNEIISVANIYNFKAILLDIDLPKVPSLLIYQRDLTLLIDKFPVKIFYRTSKEVDKSLAEFLKSNDLLKKKNLRIASKDIIRAFLPINRNLRRIIKPLFPRAIWVYFALKIGPNRVRDTNIVN
jgi:FkbM family methyltransferase